MSATDARRFARREAGTSLVLVLMFATAISSFCLFSLASSQAVYKTAKVGLERTRAFYVAEGGADYALSQLNQDPYWAASATTEMPTVLADGSFQSDWIPLGSSGGTFQVHVTYENANAVPSTWTSTGFPTGFVPYTIVTFATRTAKPTFNRTIVTATGKYNGVTRTVTANVKSAVMIYSGAIIDDGAQTPGSGNGKAWAISNGPVVMDGVNQYVWGGMRANGGVYLDRSTAPITAANVGTSLTHFSGDIQTNLAGTADEIPKFTDPGSATQLFDFGRFQAAAAAGAGATYTLSGFVTAMNAANLLGTHLQGIIYVTVDASKSNSLNVPGGINIDGTLVFHFINTSDAFYKIAIDDPLHINAAPLTSAFNPLDSSTFATGYPPALPVAKDPRNVDISALGYTNFAAGDDLPALMFDTGTVDIHGETNISGTVYSPSYMEIENHNNRQYFNGSIIGGAGIYVNGNNGSNASQTFVFDPNAVDSLATFANEAKTPVISAYVVGQ